MFGPKVEGVVSSEPISQSGAFGMLSRFLRTEQQKHDPVSIHQSHWEDLYRVAETLAESQHEQETLRELRRMVAPPVSSPPIKGAGHHFVLDDEDETTTPSEKLIPVDHTSSIVKHQEEAETTECTVSKNAEDEKAAMKAVKKEKKAKKEKKKAKKRKRESSD